MKVGEKVQRTIVIPVAIERTKRGELQYTATIAGAEMTGTVEVSDEFLAAHGEEPLERIVMDCVEGNLLESVHASDEEEG